jgi:hypothetical protein
MATGPGIILNPRPDGRPTWQLLKTPTAAQTAVTAAKLTQSFKDVAFAEDNFEVIDVSMFAAIAAQVWGVAADTNTFTIELYGWAEGGPGDHIQQMAANIFGAFVSAANVGFHQSSSTHKSIRNAFAAATDYRGADTYLLTASKDFTVKKELVSPAVQIQTNLEADFPAGFLVDFSTTRFKYFGIAATATTGTSVGAIFKPLKLKSP